MFFGGFLRDHVARMARARKEPRKLRSSVCLQAAARAFARAGPRGRRNQKRCGRTWDSSVRTVGFSGVIRLCRLLGVIR